MNQYISDLAKEVRPRVYMKRYGLTRYTLNLEYLRVRRHSSEDNFAKQDFVLQAVNELINNIKETK